MAKSPEKAYKNLDFLNSKDARILRILAEYIEPESRFRREKVKDTIVFFGSARTRDKARASAELQEWAARAEADPSEENLAGKRLAEKHLEMSRYYEDARTLGKQLTEWAQALPNGSKRYLITSGGGPGIMEAANRGASEAPNGESVGLNISIPMEQGCNDYITDKLNFEFHYFFTRKFWFVYLARAIVVFPGGFGTFDELFEVLTLVQTKKIKPKTILLYGEKYWKSVINFEAMVENLVISAKDLSLFSFADDPQTAFKYLTTRLENNH